MTDTQKYRKSRRVRKFQARRRRYRRTRFLFFAVFGEAVFVGTLVLIGLSLLGALR